jgi:plastocyanin
MIDALRVPRRGAILTMTLVLGLVLAACSSGSSDSSEPAASNGGGAVEVTDGVAAVSADDLAFSTDGIVAPAGEDFVIELTNNDSVPHNISVYTEQGGDELAQGDVINEGETTEVSVAALEPGTYYFVCDLHPEMNGTLVVEG